MNMVKAGLRPAFGLFVIAHALAHTVLPTRGSMDPSMGPIYFVPLMFYSVAAVCLMSAGLGVFGIRPFPAVMRPAMVLGAAYSLIGLIFTSESVLWFGVAGDVVLLVTGVTGSYRHLPSPMPSHRQARILGT